MASEHPYAPLGSSGADAHSQSTEEAAAGAPVDSHDFGEKTIGFWGSCVLNFNNITGPAVIVLPLLFQQAGWLLPCLGLLLMWLCSSFAATMLCESMQRIPRNTAFRCRYEYTTLVRHYFGERWHYLAQVGFNAGLTASNVLSMVITSQVLDSVLARVLGSSYGVSYASWPLEVVTSSPLAAAAAQGCSWGTVAAAADNGASAACNKSIISMGYLLSMVVCIPMGHLNLDSNMGFQWASMLAQLLCSLQFAYELVLRSLPGSDSFCPGSGPHHTPIIGPQYAQVVGVCVFAFSYVSTIPSWANEKKPGVSVNSAVWLPSSVGVALNILLGLLGAWAYNLLDYSHTTGPGQTPVPYSGTDDILNLLDGNADPRVFTCSVEPGQAPVQYSVSWITELCVYIWGIGGYLPGIPILAIMVRYNLQSSGILGHHSAFFWAVVAPWVFTAFFYQAEALLQFCSWVALLCQGFINLVIPILLYRQALLWYPSQEELDATADATAQNVARIASWVLPGSRGSPNQGPVCHLWNAIGSLGALPASVPAQESLHEKLLDDTRDSAACLLGRAIICNPHGLPKEHHVGLLLYAPPHGEQAEATAESKDEHAEEPAVDSVPQWLQMRPLHLANAMVWFLTVAVIASIIMSFFV